MSVRVLLADDQALVRAGFRALLDATDGIEVVGEAGDGDEAVRLAVELVPDVVLMDVRMPGTDGLAATGADHRRPAAGRRAGRRADDLRARRVRLRGAAGRRERVPRQGHRAGRAAARGAGGRGRRRAAVAGRHPPAGRGVRRRAPGPAPCRGGSTRSPTASARSWRSSREGLSNEEIAARLFLSPATAKTHVSRAMGKLGVRDRAQLVVLAYESGLVRPGWA